MFGEQFWNKIMQIMIKAPNNAEELWQKIETTCNEITLKYRRTLIKSMPNRLQSSF